MKTRGIAFLFICYLSVISVCAEMPSEENLFRHAETYFNQGRLDMAEKRCNQILQSKPNQNQAKELLLKISLVRQCFLEIESKKPKGDVGLRMDGFGKGRVLSSDEIEKIKEAFQNYRNSIQDILDIQ